MGYSNSKDSERNQFSYLISKTERHYNDKINPQLYLKTNNVDSRRSSRMSNVEYSRI